MPVEKELASSSSHKAEATRVPILTIGYGSERTADAFLSLLGRFGVKYLVDVRTKPYSRIRPEFCREPLEVLASRAGLVYVFMGDTLGGMPADADCYVEGKVDYTRVRGKEWFQQGLNRLEHAWRSGHRLALMCAELEPERCHRSKLIGEALAARGIAVEHIDERGALVDQRSVLERLTRGQGTLFQTGWTSRGKYRSGGDAEGEVA